MKARQQPIVVDVWQVEIEPIPRWLAEASALVVTSEGVEVFTALGRMTANVGDWIVRRGEGTLHCYSRDVFEQAFETAY